MPRDYPYLRKTAYDLYAERDCLPWHFRATTLVCSWLVLAGYILFALVFTSEAANLKTSRTILISIGVAFLLVGYATVAVAAMLSKSLLFCLDAILLPFLTSSVLGLAAIVFNHALHKTFPVSDIYIIIPLVLASASTVIAGALSGFIYYRIQRIRMSDNRRKVRAGREERLSWAGIGESGSTQELLPSIANMPIPEDELQRQQLLRLLLRREAQRAPSPDGSASTYRIDLPSPLNGDDYLAVPSPADKGGLPGSATWLQLSKLLGGGRGRRARADSFKDPRERRREEIERGGSFGSAGSSAPLNGWPSPIPYTPGMPGTPGTPPAWSQSTRYA